MGELDAKLPSNMAWVPGNGANIPVEAVYASDSTTNAVRSYVCRVQMVNNYFIGSLKINGRCYVTDGAVASGQTTFQILTITSGNIGDVMSTVVGTGNSIPAKSLAMGLKDGRPQYLCFIPGQGDFFIGGADTQSNGCAIADFGSGKVDYPVHYTATSGYVHGVGK